MSLPNLPHLQCLVVSILDKNPSISGQELRERMCIHDAKYGQDPTFYMLMGRMEKAKLITKKKVRGKKSTQCYYKVTAKARKQLRVSVDFYTPIIDRVSDGRK